MRRVVQRVRAGGGVALVAVALLALALAGCGALVTPPSPPVKANGSTAITAPYPTKTSTTPIYSAPLTAAAPGWAAGATCQFTAQGLLVRPQGGQAYICLAPATLPADLSVSVTVTQVSGLPNHAYGIAFRHAAPKSYYFFGIDARGRFTLDVVVNDRSTRVIPFTPSAAIQPGLNVANTLRVTMQGQTATLFANDTAVGQATLSTFSDGSVGLRGINAGDVRFQQLTVAALG